MCFHLQAGDGEAASVIRQSGDGDDERRVWDVFIVELNGNLIITWRGEITAKGQLRLLCHVHTSVAQYNCSHRRLQIPALLLNICFEDQVKNIVSSTRQTIFT